MAYCVQCGDPMSAQDDYCGACGQAAPGVEARPITVLPTTEEAPVPTHGRRHGIDHGALQLAANALYSDLGSLTDLPKELRDTLANIYHKIFAVSRNPRGILDSYSTDTSFVKAVEGLSDMSHILWDFEYTKKEVKLLREMRDEGDAISYNLNYAPIRRSHRRWSCGGSGSRVNSVISQVVFSCCFPPRLSRLPDPGRAKAGWQAACSQYVAASA